MNIIGLSSFYHDSSVCLIQNGRLVAAVSEERFSRKKHDHRIPIESFKYCLKVGGIGISDVEVIAYYEDPIKKKERQNWAIKQQVTDPLPNQFIDQNPFEMIKELFGFEEQIIHFDHHQSHAASAYFFSGFDESAIFTADGVGEWATTTYGYGRKNEMSIFKQIEFPDSIGLFYSAITAFLGFRVNNGEYKVMGLASYGKPVYYKVLKKLIYTTSAGEFKLDTEYFDFIAGEAMFSEKLVNLLDLAPRKENEVFSQAHMNLARSCQLVFEEILVDCITYLKSKVQSNNLCMAGGVALNCVANSKIRQTNLFKNIFIQPAAGDAGGCLGAAVLAWNKFSETPFKNEQLKSVFLGPSFDREIGFMTNHLSTPVLSFVDNEDELIEFVATELAKDKIIGWFQGRMEFGPRALGGRSILANPINKNMKQILNERIKRRESFRPFGATILHQFVKDYFIEMDDSDFMLLTTQVHPNKNLPPITHVDNSCRPQFLKRDQNPKFYKLIKKFYEKTGSPMLINTSFNLKGEPIVCTPIDAYVCFVKSGLDILVLNNHLIHREDISVQTKQLIYQMTYTIPDLKEPNLYTFV